MNLYTSQKPKTSRYVDNMVDNVDKRVWITHTVFVHNAENGKDLLYGKAVKRKGVLQEILPEFEKKLEVRAENGRQSENRTCLNTGKITAGSIKARRHWREWRAAGILIRNKRPDEMPGMEEQKMRMFIAVPLPPDVVRAVAHARAALEGYGAAGRFVPRENYHVTLHFLGETDQLMEAAGAVGEACKDIHPFVLRLGGYGSFKSEKSHTGFVSVSCDSDELDKLYESLEAALWERGFVKNRGRLTPHITLGRRIEGDEGFVLPPRNVAFTANMVTLYESRSENGVMRYTSLHRERLV